MAAILDESPPERKRIIATAMAIVSNRYRAAACGGFAALFAEKLCFSVKVITPLRGYAAGRDRQRFSGGIAAISYERSTGEAELRRK